MRTEKEVVVRTVSFLSRGMPGVHKLRRRPIETYSNFLEREGVL